MREGLSQLVRPGIAIFLCCSHSFSGAYYGYSNLSELTCDNSTLGIEMSFVETFLNGFYDFNVTSAASLFFHLRRGHVID